MKSKALCRMSMRNKFLVKSSNFAGFSGAGGVFVELLYERIILQRKLEWPIFEVYEMYLFSGKKNWYDSCT